MYDSIQYFHQACQNVVDNRTERALNWAVGYAEYGLTVTEKYEAKVQAMYLKGNITRWRGAIAKETRSILAHIIKNW